MEKKQLLADEAERLRFHLEKMHHYFSFFADRWRAVVIAERVVALAMFALSIYFIMRPQPSCYAIAAPIVGFVSIMLDIILNASGRMGENDSIAAEYGMLLRSLPVSNEEVTEEQIREISKRRIDRESGRTIYPCVVTEMHNLVAEAKFRKPDYAMSAWERTVGMWCPVKYRVKPMPHVEEAFRRRAERRVREAEAEAAAK